MALQTVRAIQKLCFATYILQLSLNQEYFPVQEDSSGLCSNPKCECRGAVRKQSSEAEVWKAEESGLSKTSPSLWGVTEMVSKSECKVVELQSFASFRSGRTGRRRNSENRAWITETFAVTMPWFHKATEFFRKYPTLDGFVSLGKQRLQNFWTKAEDSFMQDWSSEVLWLNPPFSQMDRVVRKVLMEGASGLLVIPCWHRFLWFTVLFRVAGNWWDIPQEAEFFQTIHGRPLKQRPDWATRVLHFDASK